jgi:tRNA pseudouridine55 synthase
MDGWLNIYKPKGISSARAVAIVKRILGYPKTGHTGTLDVEAEGVLPLAIGEATKLVKFLMDAKKTYIFTVKFGAQTDTGDSAGKIIASSDVLPTEEKCRDICKEFIGTITQSPPIYSALKVNGKRAYKLARENKPVELAKRQIQIYKLCLLEFDNINHTAKFEVECSKGTYIRTLAEDIALSLQSLGFVVELRREAVGIFKASDAINIETICASLEEASYKLLKDKSLKIEAVLDDILVLNATEDQAKKIRYGQKCFFELKADIDSVWIHFNGAILAIGSISDNCFNSSRVFNIIQNKENSDVDYR